MDDQMFDSIQDSSIYCKMECKVIMDGYVVFRTWMLKHTQLDVYNCITLQSVASTFMLSSCYQNVYQITKCVVGGRVMCNSNKQYHVNNNTAYFDVCNL